MWIGCAAPSLALPRLGQLEPLRKAGCSAEFLKFLVLHLEDRTFAKDQLILQHTMPSDDCCMLVFVEGVAKVVTDLLPGCIQQYGNNTAITL